MKKLEKKCVFLLFFLFSLSPSLSVLCRSLGLFSKRAPSRRIQTPNSLLTTLEDQPAFFRKEDRGPDAAGDTDDDEEEEGESSARHCTAMVPLAGTAAATSPPTRAGADGGEEEDDEELEEPESMSESE